MIGSTLGPYRILDKLGEGGMGEVYRAHDAKLGRDVAIKILPDAFTADAERVTRFEREARTLASLNHPNIAQIYGMEDGGLVMELCQGEDLAAIMKRGAIPLSDALPIAKQIATALGVAHEAGVIHRDLKPANIKVAPDGTVKVLDFGLAKALDTTTSSAAAGALSNSPTMTSPATKFGVILGTAAYMSPEQARGKPVDRRADVWAFGVVLYEMLTGRRAFGGNEVSDVLASVLKDNISLEALPADTPAPVRRLLRRCLEKDRSNRLDSMATARLEIDEAIAQPVEGAAAARIPKPARRSLVWWAGMATTVIGALGLAGWAGHAANGTHVSASPSIAFTIPSPPGRVDGIALTPLADAVVYTADRMYVRAMSDTEPRPLAGTEGASNLFLSTNGQWAGFYVGGKIRRVALSGGDPSDITNATTDTPGAGWGPGETVIFSSGWNSPLSSVPADGGGAAKVISTVDTQAGELGHWWPRMLPDGKSLLFTIWMAASGINDSKIGVLDLATGKHRVVMAGADARYLPSGHLVFFRAGAYAIVPFNLATLQPAGEPRPIRADVRSLSPTGSSLKSLAVADDGTIAYVAGKLVPESEFAWVTAAGVVEAVGLPVRSYYRVSMAPDGRRAVSSVPEGGRSTLYVQDLVRKTDERLDLPGSNLGPIWSARGDFIAYTAMDAGHFDAYSYDVNLGRAVPLITEPYDQTPIAVTQDGKGLVLMEYYGDGSAALTVADLDHPKVRRKRTVPIGETNFAAVSPDGHWVAVLATVAGRQEIVVQPFPQDGLTVPVSSRGSFDPVWSSTGSTLYYRRGDELVAAAWSVNGGRFTIASDKTLWRLSNFNLVGQAPDGRFLVTRRRSADGETLRVITNWVK